MISAPRVNLLTAIEEILADDWQISSVWLVPPSSDLNKSGRVWEAHVTRPNYISSDQVIELPPMSDQEARVIAVAIQNAGDGSAIHHTSSGCLVIGPTAAWCRGPLRNAIFAVRN